VSPYEGSSRTYCSPTADALRTADTRSAGILGVVLSARVAVAAFRGTSIAVTLPTCTPRYVMLENRYRPPAAGSSSLTVILTMPSKALDPDKARQHQPPPPGSHGPGAAFGIASNGGDVPTPSGNLV
jgi:hypothetical protein